MSLVLFAAPSTRFNMSAAEPFGDIEFLMDGDVVNAFRTDDLVKRVHSELDELNFNPETDFFGITGATATVAIVFGVMLAKYKRVRVLLFDAVNDGYVERVVGADAS